MKRVRSIPRPFEILDSFQVEQSQSISEISRSIGIPESTAFEILSTLEDLGVLAKDGASGLHQPGNRLIDLGNRVRIRYLLNRVAAPHLKALKDEFDEKVYLTVRDCDQVYCVDDMEHEEGVRCIHAPLRNSGGRVIGAISLSGFAQRVSGEGEIAEKVVGAAREISRVLDCNP